ncbi:hypothetical protein [Paenibacillus piri]|uniref:hypothetical protein n=1 Tax=Paenibacillus piri TaxID=2547395 RepID=UPI00140450CC|nr:hypothetical protein [Paenibacillus piri]
MEENENNTHQNENLTDEQQSESARNRAKFNAANEKLLEDQLQVSEDKLFDYVPGEE